MIYYVSVGRGIKLYSTQSLTLMILLTRHTIVPRVDGRRRVHKLFVFVVVVLAFRTKTTCSCARASSQQHRYE